MHSHATISPHRKRSLGACRRAMAVVATLCLAAWTPVARAEEPAAERGGQQWCLLIAVEDYELVRPKLRFTINDAEQIAQTLAERGQCRAERVLKMTDAGQGDLRPTRANLQRALPEWLARPAPEDEVIVYFSGHGSRAGDKLYLLTIDCDPKNIAETAVSLEWFRDQLAGCRAKTKLLILDACHAGSAKGGTVKSVAAKELAVPFEKLGGGITLASCTGEEQSLLWEAKRQSLFSYWLNQGLRGHADRDGDAAVTIDELYAYVYDQVPYVAEKLHSHKQTPARIIGPDAPGVAVVIRPKPQNLKGALADMAEKLATTIQLRGLEAVGVPEFAVDAKKAELELGADFGLLGRYCATELEGFLLDRSAERFDVLPQAAVHEALRQKGVDLPDLVAGTPKSLAPAGRPMPAIVLGILRARAGREVTIQCELRALGVPRKLAIAGGVAELNEQEWGMIARSVRVFPADRRPELDNAGNVVRPATTAAIAALDRRSQGSHPLADPSCPFRVRVLVGGEERRPYFAGNDMFVALRRGETYRIGVENRTGRPVMLRLLVDGLNTLPEMPRTKGVGVEATAIAS